MAILGSPETGGLPRLRLSVLRCARISALASGASSSSAGSSPRAIAARTRAQSVLLSPRSHAARISSSVIVVSFEPLIVYLSFFPARWPETDDSRCVAFGKNNQKARRFPPPYKSMSENRANMMQFEVDPANPPKLSKAAMRRLAQIQDRAIDYSDIPPLSDEWFEQAGKRAHVPLKRPVSLRLDQDIIDYFRKQGRRYQTRINAVLRAYVESQKHA